jgi:hypothetical protein
VVGQAIEDFGRRQTVSGQLDAKVAVARFRHHGQSPRFRRLARQHEATMQALFLFRKRVAKQHLADSANSLQPTSRLPALQEPPEGRLPSQHDGSDLTASSFECINS